MADPAFSLVWDRADRPVDERLVSRSWTWGPDGFHTAYFDWRYRTPATTPTPVQPTPTPMPAAGLTLSATSGNASTPITVTGKLFPSRSVVTVNVENKAANYSKAVGKVQAEANGSFSIKVTVPVEAARLGSFEVVALANDGAVRASLGYKVLALFSANEVVTGQKLALRGVGYKGNIDVNGGLMTGNSTKVNTVVARVKTAADGSFETSFAVNQPVGTRFKIAAWSEDGFKLISKEVRVVAAPALEVVPGSGSAGVEVTLKGTNWPANRPIKIGRDSVESRDDFYYDQQPVTDANGNFTFKLRIGSEYSVKKEVHLWAIDEAGKAKLDAYYKIVK